MALPEIAGVETKHVDHVILGTMQTFAVFASCHLLVSGCRLYMLPVIPHDRQLQAKFIYGGFVCMLVCSNGLEIDLAKVQFLPLVT